MGRAKLPIQKIENSTNRKVTFSKRKNGLMKKAYELSVLCDVDVALVMISPSGTVSKYSNRSVEEIMARYIDLRVRERERQQYQEFLQRALSRLQGEACEQHIHQQARNTARGDSQLEATQQEVIRCKLQLLDVENRLRVFEGDPLEIITMSEAVYREQILEETLKRVRARKQALEGMYNSIEAPASSSQVPLQQEAMNINGMVTTNQNMRTLDLLPQSDPQVKMMNLLNYNGLLSSRDEPEPMEPVLTPILAFLSGQNGDTEEHMSRGSGMEDDNNVNVQQPDFGQIMNAIDSPWTQFHPNGNGPLLEAQPGEQSIDEILLSQFTP